MQAERNARSPQPGECLNVCAACGGHVVVVPVAGIPPHVNHEPDCSREGWPVRDAIAYEDGLAATRDNWPNGDGGKYAREQESKRAERDVRMPNPDCDQCYGDGYILTGGTPVHAADKAWCPSCYPEMWAGVEVD